MFIASVPLNNGSLREERHVEYACTLRSYRAHVANVAEGYKPAAPPEQRGEPSMSLKNQKV